jgi:hypothetical protein
MNGNGIRKEAHETLGGILRSYLTMYIIFILIALLIGACTG